VGEQQKRLSVELTKRMLVENQLAEAESRLPSPTGSMSGGGGEAKWSSSDGAPSPTSAGLAHGGASYLAEMETAVVEIECVEFEHNGSLYLIDQISAKVYSHEGDNDFLGKLRADGSIDFNADDSDDEDFEDFEDDEFAPISSVASGSDGSAARSGSSELEDAMVSTTQQLSSSSPPLPTESTTGGAAPALKASKIPARKFAYAADI
jgi:hypothetical protein